MSKSRAGATSSATQRGIEVRRNLFNQHLSRRPTSNSSSNVTLSETFHLRTETPSINPEIVVRDHNGDFLMEDISAQSQLNNHENSNTDPGDEERLHLINAFKNHQRDRDWVSSEPAVLLEAVMSSLKAKVAALSEDNWRYEADEDSTT